MKNIKAVGYINIESKIYKAEGSIKANNFLNLFVNEFAIQSSKYAKFTGEAPFTYREKQLHSIIAPALLKFTDAFLMEHPVDRKWSSIRNEDYNDSHGWVDYWCRFREVDFFIEIKHSYVSFESGRITKNTGDLWRYANTQLKTLQKEAKLFSQFCKGAFLLVIHIIPFYENVKITEEPKSISDYDSMIGIQNHYMEKLKPTPKWTALWELNAKLAEGCRAKHDEKFQYYPGVLFISNVSNFITDVRK